MRLARYHGLGNDYLVLEDGVLSDLSAAITLCDRHRGLGADGVLLPFATERADLGVTIVNPDGSVAEKSGNGLRILAQWWVDSGRAPGRVFDVWTGFERVACEVGPLDVTLDMGLARFEPEAIGLDAAKPWIDHTLEGPDGPFVVTTLSVGNPHCVCFVARDDLDALPWQAWGAWLERYPRFLHRINVQFARVHPDHLAFRVFERGAGPTMASGSSAVAVTAAAWRTGRVRAGEHEVRMQGGSLWVHIDAHGHTRLRGPVERVGVIEPDDAWLLRHGLIHQPKPLPPLASMSSS